MRTGIPLAGVIVIGLLMTVIQSPAAEGLKGEETKHMEKKQVMSQAVYCCPDCHTLVLEAGTCPMCQKELQESHLLGTKDGEALVCGCGGSCKCDAKGVKDGKCACGKDVKKMSAKGMYVCPEGCPIMSEKAEKCPHCGMEMKMVE